MKSNHEMKKWDYVVIISEHNISEMYACLYFKPQRILMIATNYFKDAEGRFTQIMKQKLPMVDCVSVDTENLQGDSFYETKEWISEKLLPIFDENNQQVLNATGGTKALSIALEKSIDWYQVHYKPMTKNTVEIWADDWAVAEREIHPSNSLIDDFSINDACSLYIDKIDKDKTPHFVPDEEQALNISKKMWSCLVDGHIHVEFAKYLSKLWATNRTQEWTRIKWDEFNLDEIQLHELQIWFEILSQLCPDVLRTLPLGLLIRTRFNGNKKIKAQREWVKGTWLEDLVLHWLLEDLKMPENLIHAGMQIETDIEAKNRQGSGREIDICLLHNQQIFLIEIKADLPTHTDFKNAVRQLASIVALKGAQKILLLGPWASKTFFEKEQENESLARGSQVQVITSKAQLIEKFSNASK